jgi:hypothetical protein
VLEAHYEKARHTRLRDEPVVDQPRLEPLQVFGERPIAAASIVTRGEGDSFRRAVGLCAATTSPVLVTSRSLDRQLRRISEAQNVAVSEATRTPPPVSAWACARARMHRLGHVAIRPRTFVLGRTVVRMFP